MLYTYAETLKIFLRIYDYLQMKMKEQPRSVKMDKPTHRKAVISFLESLPPSAGADFIWDFLIFQFYIYYNQKHALRPMPVWFIGKEAWVRWKTYGEGSLFYAKDWEREKRFINPVKRQDYCFTDKETFLKERFRMSRISGPNFCVAKYGENPFCENENICKTCPFFKDCSLLFSKKNNKNLFQEISCLPVCMENNVNIIFNSKLNRLDEE